MAEPKKETKDQEQRVKNKQASLVVCQPYIIFRLGHCRLSPTGTAPFWALLLQP